MFIWFPDATITHNVREEKMQKGQPAHHNFLSAVASGLIIMAGAGITAMSTMGLYMLAFKWYCPNIFPYAFIVSPREEGGFVVLSFLPLILGLSDCHLVYPSSLRDNFLETEHQ